jgi:hypothetical protein
MLCSTLPLNCIQEAQSVYVMKCSLVFCVRKADFRKLLNTESLKIYAATFVMYDVLIYKTVSHKNF